MKNRIDYRAPQNQDTPGDLKQVLDCRWSAFSEAFAQDGTTSLKRDEHLKLYAASRRLREAIEDRAVAEAVIEIGANLLACEQMAIVVLPVHWEGSVSLHAAGLTSRQCENLRFNADRIASAVPEGSVFVQGDDCAASGWLASLGIRAHVPLWQNRTKRGAIVFFDLLPQKTALDEEDRAVLKLLAIYAGPCLFNS
jgi:hypothetical protein